MINVLFVCLGNICRSPVAEGVFRQLVHERGLAAHIHCDSAGTGAYHVGSLPDRRMRNVATARGLQLTHKARQLAQGDYENFQYILAMDDNNFEHIRREAFHITGTYPADGQLFLFRTFDPDRGGATFVPDPYYDELLAFEQVYEIVRRAGNGFLDFLVEKHQLDGRPEKSDHAF